jgi:thiol-disulfide isomerase/thioredoxin
MSQRRDILKYLGLGCVGAGIATTIGQKLQPSQSNAKVFNPNSSLTPSNEIAIPAESYANKSAGKTLPELQGISNWINTEPLTLASLRGNVILLQFWTFACSNCQATIPHLVGWHDRYADKGLKIVSVHTPEFPYERELNNIKQAVKKRNIKYAVAVDNGFETWKAYQNEYWPHLFLADRQGKIVYDHIGEGAYAETENKIRKLLGKIA